LLEGGHAPNALPQRAVAVLNCRILPGHASADVLRSITQTIADDKIEVKWQFIESTDWPASPVRPEVLSAMSEIAQRLWPGISAMPILEPGASDGRFLRDAGIPTYGISGVFIDLDDVREHGRDERIRVRDFYGGLEFYNQFVKILTAH
jgi:acetylornithine deacetylase/succinyl-diaminopimelate desuccinylase-like protein